MAQVQQTDKPLTPPIVAATKTSDIDEQLKLEQLWKLQHDRAEAEKKQALELEIFQQQRQARLDVAKNLQLEQKKNMELQHNCLHSTGGASIVVGMRTWSSHIPKFVCQSCLKIWEDEYPPGHLLPKPDMIGGPQIG